MCDIVLFSRTIWSLVRVCMSMRRSTWALSSASCILSLKLASFAISFSIFWWSKVAHLSLLGTSLNCCTNLRDILTSSSVGGNRTGFTGPSLEPLVSFSINRSEFCSTNSSAASSRRGSVSLSYLLSSRPNEKRSFCCCSMMLMIRPFDMWFKTSLSSR